VLLCLVSKIITENICIEIRTLVCWLSKCMEQNLLEKLKSNGLFTLDL
jgi:hypothetical protein